MPLDTKPRPCIFDALASPSIPDGLTLQANEPYEPVKWRDTLITLYDPVADGRRPAMVPWWDMLRILSKKDRTFWGASMLDFVRQDEKRMHGLGLPLEKRLVFIGTVYSQTGHSEGRQKNIARSRQVFRALERLADGTYREIIVPRSGYWLRDRDLIAAR